MQTHVLQIGWQYDSFVKYGRMNGHTRVSMLNYYQTHVDNDIENVYYKMPSVLRLSIHWQNNREQLHSKTLN